VLGFAPGVALTEDDRLERAVREAREVQARQNQNSDPEVGRRAPDGQKWLKANESRDGKDRSTESTYAVGSGIGDTNSDCVSRIKMFTDSVSENSTMKFDKRDLANVAGQQCADWLWDQTPGGRMTKEYAPNGPDAIFRDPKPLTDPTAPRSQSWPGRSVERGLRSSRTVV
jgi:hypothetical protein